MTGPEPGRTHRLSSDDRERLDSEGFVVLRGVVPRNRLRALQETFEGVVDDLARQWRDEGFLHDTADGEPFDRRFATLRRQLPPRFPTSWRKILVSPAVYELWQEPSLLGPVREVIGEEVYAHGVWNGRPREPLNADVQRIGWHQDAHYYKGWDAADGKLLTMWMPLVPVDASSGALQVIPGSHRRGYIPRVRSENGLFVADPAALGSFEPVTADMEPGDALIFTDLTVHRALDNVSERVRWSIDIRFGEATHAIISKTPRGYRCHSAVDPASVERFDVWARRYDYGFDELAAELENSGAGRGLGASELAAMLGTSRSELESY